DKRVGKCASSWVQLVVPGLSTRPGVSRVSTAYPCADRYWCLVGLSGAVMAAATAPQNSGHRRLVGWIGVIIESACHHSCAAASLRINTVVVPNQFAGVWNFFDAHRP